MMQWLKEFISSGNNTLIPSKDNGYLFLGALGGCLTFLGLFLPVQPAQICFVAGSALLLITAVYFKLIYFIALEVILISGHGAMLFEIGTKLQIALPILLSLQLLMFYYLSGQLTNIFILVGITGIALLAVGFAYQDQFIFFGGSSAIAIYAIYAAKQTKPAWLWGIINISFSLCTLYKIIF
jgi:hypothetical protein